MVFISNRIDSINSNKDKNNNIYKNNKSNFKSDEKNFDLSQSNFMKIIHTNLNNNINYNFLTNGYDSVYDNLDYVECINNNCTKIKSEIIENKKKDLVKDKIPNRNNNIVKSLDILLSLVYIFLLVILLLGSVINKDAINLINILIITLIYLFYQIYISFKK